MTLSNFFLEILNKFNPLLEARINSSSDFTDVAVTISGSSKISFLLELKFNLNNFEILLISNQYKVIIY